MADAEATAPSSKPKVSRRTLTPAERIAKAETELARLRTQAVERDRRTMKIIDDKIAKLVIGIKARQTDIDSLNVLRAALTGSGADPELPFTSGTTGGS